MQDGDGNPDRPPHPRILRPGTDPRIHRETGVDFPVCVVLPAGGTGERTGLQTPKQFWSFLDRPLISYTVDAFERVSWIRDIVVAVAEENLDRMTDIIQRFGHRKVRLVTGGSTRHRSIYNGVQALAEDSPEVVIIHDAVRPFVEEDFLSKITLAAKEHGAAGAIRPLVSTVIAATAEGFLDHSLERAKYRASETPQGFTYDVISRAYQRSSESDLEFGTECLHLALQHCHTNAKLIPGPPTLWKVTYQWDLAAAGSVIKEPMLRSACVVSGDSVHALALIAALQNALHVKLHVVPELSEEKHTFLLKEWNYIQVSVGVCCRPEVEALVTRLEGDQRVLLYPLVIIWLNLITSNEKSCRTTEEEKKKNAIMDLASSLEHKKILLYGIQLQTPKDSEDWDRSVLKASELISVLVKERSPALVGQLLQA